MMHKRFPLKDPRTVARDIPGVLNAIFPHLTAGMTSYFNKKIYSNVSIRPLSEIDVAKSALSRAMLFEISAARVEYILGGNLLPDWNTCVDLAIKRQRRHFDAKIPSELADQDMILAKSASNNLLQMLNDISGKIPDKLIEVSPIIPGYQWIASGRGDFSIGEVLIEVKHTNKNFGSADYRQVLLYWLLSYASKIEFGTQEWKRCILINPRLNKVLEIEFDEMISACSSGQDKIRILELFSSFVGDYALKILPEFKL